MQELFSIDKVEVTEETYILRIEVPKPLFHYFKSIFTAFIGISQELRFKAKIAEALSIQRQEQWRQEVRQRDDAIKSEMRSFYESLLLSGQDSSSAMKAVTKEFKQWVWIREAFRKEIKVKQELEILRLFKQGLTSFQIADRIGLHPGTVRKIISEGKRHGT